MLAPQPSQRSRSSGLTVPQEGHCHFLAAIQRPVGSGIDGPPVRYRSQVRSHCSSVRRGPYGSATVRLLVARCEVRYSGRLNALLPEALRLIIVKADGSVLIHADAGGYKPLNWMTPPTVIEESPETILVRKRGQAEATGSRSPSPRCSPTSSHDMGSPDEDTALTKDGVEAHLQELLADQPHVVRRGVPARPSRVADRHRPGRPDVP